MKIDVLKPIRTPASYEFQYIVQHAKQSQYACNATENPHQFGFRAINFELLHSELWDSIYPLGFLTRKGGPLFGKGNDSATIQFDYPVLERVASFYTNRARNFGYNINIVGETYDRSFDLPTSGCSLSFGGGKDSRMLLGLLRETGYRPDIYTSGVANATDIPQAKITESLTGVQMDRVMPTLMSLPRVFVFGSGLGGVTYRDPWQQYYDWGSRSALREMCLMLKSLGVEMDLIPPASVLPSNLIQKILYDRYPALYRHQRSVRIQAPNEKNLDLSLLKIYHGIDFRDTCSDALFKSLLKKFVRKQTSKPEDFGFRRHREVINREMRAIISKKLQDPMFEKVRELVPDHWEGQWIDYIHPYVYADIDPAFLEIYQEYAPILPVKDRSMFRVSTAPA